MGFARDLIEAVTGFTVIATLSSKAPPRPRRLRPDQQAAPAPTVFRFPALQFESRSPLFRAAPCGYCGSPWKPTRPPVRRWMPTQRGGRLLHDIGMMLLPESTWLKVGPHDRRRPRRFAQPSGLRHRLAAAHPGVAGGCRRNGGPAPRGPLTAAVTPTSWSARKSAPGRKSSPSSDAFRSGDAPNTSIAARTARCSAPSPSQCLRQPVRPRVDRTLQRGHPQDHRSFDGR